MNSRGGDSVQRAREKISDPIPVTAWWRCCARDEIAEREAQLREELLRRTRGLVADELINQAQLWNPRISTVALHVGTLLRQQGAEQDLVMSWVAVAAVAGNGLACRMIADAYMEVAGELVGRGEGVDAVLVLDQAVDWLFDLYGMHFDHRKLLSKVGRSELKTVLEMLEPGEAVVQGAPKMEKSRAQRRAASADVPKLQVLKEVGDGNGKEGKDIARRYKRLTEPLNLAGANLDPEVLTGVLRMEFPWFECAIAAITDDLRLLRIAGVPWVRLRPTLLVGPPGGGKTRFARRVGQLAGTGSDLISASGSSDNRMLMGTARGWSSAQPALPLLTMARAGTANPVIVVDEIDKVADDNRNGDIRSVLLMLLERETAKVWMDECLLAPCDLSQISWLLTANELERVPKPLLSRLRVVRVGAPKAEHFDVLYHGLLRDLADELTVSPSLLPALDLMVIEYLREQFRQGISVRKLRAAIAAALASACPDARRLN